MDSKTAILVLAALLLPGAASANVPFPGIKNEYIAGVPGVSVYRITDDTVAVCYLATGFEQAISISCVIPEPSARARRPSGRR